ncbi:MAG: nicotinate-nucleotide adenylyltransferase [Actinomycetota bacterium]|nr:nicotinate-nucleotide adenylyltransferase [Actinomycetota bacterium]
MSPSRRRGVYPGSFDPPTIAHLAIAEAARRAAELDRLDLAISRFALGKDAETQRPLEARLGAMERLTVSRPWLRVVVTDSQLIVDIAAGYDAVVMGADKWAQVRDPAWYGDDPVARDDALARLPRVLVAPRPGFPVVGAEVLDLPADLGEVSSTAARAGGHHLIAPEARHLVVPEARHLIAPEARHFVVPEARRRLIVDGNNVIGSRPDGWWRDRSGAARRLVVALQALARRSGDQISVVLDGRPLADLPEGIHDGVLVAYATRGGRDAADDRIVAEVERDREPASLVVVTSDRALAERVRALGARVERAGTLLAQLEATAEMEARTARSDGEAEIDQ